MDEVALRGMGGEKIGVLRRCGRMLADGLWLNVREDREPELPACPGLLLDRDGVVVEEVNYLHRVEDVRLEKGAAALIRAASDRGLPVGIVTNQAGIARGYYGWEDYHAVEAEIDRQLAAAGAAVDAVVACSFHPEHTPGWSEAHAYWRKPGAGMLKLLARRLRLDLAESWMIGDNISDVAAACNAEMQGAVHVLLGHGQRDRAAALALTSDRFEVLPVDDMVAAFVVLERLEGLML